MPPEPEDERVDMFCIVFFPSKSGGRVKYFLFYSHVLRRKWRRPVTCPQQMERSQRADQTAVAAKQ